MRNLGISTESDEGGWDVDVASVRGTVHVDQGIWKSRKFRIDAPDDDCSCAESLSFSDLGGEFAMASLDKRDPGLGGVWMVWADCA